MVLIGLGGNLARTPGVPVRDTLTAALAALDQAGLQTVKCSRWYRSAPVPAADQPWFTNAVAAVATDLKPEEVLAALLAVERQMGRERSVANAARTLDLDLLAYGERVIQTERLIVPHPRIQERAFVLLPLAEVAPAWRHPVLNRTVAELIAALPADVLAAAQPEAEAR